MLSSYLREEAPLRQEPSEEASDILGSLTAVRYLQISYGPFVDLQSFL